MLDPRVQHTASIIFKACLDRKAKLPIALNFENIESYTDFVIITSGTNTRQVKAIADLVQERVFEERGLHPLGVEGYDSATWILIDFGAVICHVFLEETRQVYHLEDMWPQVRPIGERNLKVLLLGEKPRRPLGLVKARHTTEAARIGGTKKIAKTAAGGRKKSPATQQSSSKKSPRKK